MVLTWGGTFTTGGHLVVFRWAFGGIHVGARAFDGIKVGNTFTTSGHLVVFRWAFGGIHNTGGENMGPLFRNCQRQWAPIKIPSWPQLPPMSKNQHGHSWVTSPPRSNVAAQLGPT